MSSSKAKNLGWMKRCATPSLAATGHDHGPRGTKLQKKIQKWISWTSNQTFFKVIFVIHFLPLSSRPKGKRTIIVQPKSRTVKCQLPSFSNSQPGPKWTQFHMAVALGSYLRQRGPHPIGAGHCQSSCVLRASTNCCLCVLGIVLQNHLK